MRKRLTDFGKFNTDTDMRNFAKDQIDDQYIWEFITFMTTLDVATQDFNFADLTGGRHNIVLKGICGIATTYRLANDEMTSKLANLDSRQQLASPVLGVSQPAVGVENGGNVHMEEENAPMPEDLKQHLTAFKNVLAKDQRYGNSVWEDDRKTFFSLIEHSIPKTKCRACGGIGHGV